MNDSLTNMRSNITVHIPKRILRDPLVYFLNRRRQCVSLADPAPIIPTHSPAAMDWYLDVLLLATHRRQAGESRNIKGTS